MALKLEFLRRWRRHPRAPKGSAAVWLTICALGLQAGCCSPWTSTTEDLVQSVRGRVNAPPPKESAEGVRQRLPPPARRLEPGEPLSQRTVSPAAYVTRPSDGAGTSSLPQALAREQDDVAGNIHLPALRQRLRIPSSLPGAQAPQIHLPPYESVSPEIRNQLIDLLLPDLPPVWPLALPEPSSERPAITLRELQELALQYNPMLIEARGSVTLTEGAAIQAGTYPNPVVGYEADTVGSSLTRNYQGVFVSQVVKTANKLGLARAAANVEAMNAQLALRRTRLDVLAHVKAGYFSLLVAQQNVIVSDALVRFADEVYRLQRSRLKGGQAAGFEAGQLRGLANMAKVQLVLAQNDYVAAWKTLASRIGLPQMPIRPVLGRADMPVPVVTYEAALARVMALHPDIIIGRNMERKARYALSLEEVTPIPDVTFYGTVQKDYTTAGVNSTSYNTQIGLPLPIWNRNRGNIMAARGELMRASQQLRKAQVVLTERLAKTYSQYQTNRYQVELLRNHILPDYARAYRGVYEQHEADPNLMGFEGIVVAQGNLAAAVTQYIAALNLQWSAVAELSYLLQVENLEEMTAVGRGSQPALEPIPPGLPEPQQAQPGGSR